MQQSFGTGGSPSSNVNLTGTPTSVTVTTTPTKFTAEFAVPSVAGKTFGSNGNSTLKAFVQFAAAATFDITITELQLEEGVEATPFERRPITIEEMLCRRYYHRMNVPYPDESSGHIMEGYALTSAFAGFNFPLPVAMRKTPTVAVGSGADFDVAGPGPATKNVTGAGQIYMLAPTLARVIFDVDGGSWGSAGVTRLIVNAAGGVLAFDAEL